METRKEAKFAAFLLIKTDLNSFRVLGSLKQLSKIVWAKNVFGPYQLVAYAESEDSKEIAELIEDLRSRRYITELDARMVKVIPGDEDLSSFKIEKKESAVLLINVNYKEEKERIVTYNLRKVPGIKLARAMWGPADIIAVVESEDKESMRNLICDSVKTLKGVASNTTLYSYPE